MAYDSRCYDLAEVFLQDDPEVSSASTHELAQLIQDTIEDFIREALLSDEEREAAFRSRFDEPTDAEIARSQSLIAAILGPEEIAKLDAEALPDLPLSPAPGGRSDG